MKLLLDAFLYFAKFPDFDGVKKTFNNSNDSAIPGYSSFKQAVNGMAVNSLIPELKHYVFGVDENRVTKRIEDFHDFYLLVDYGINQRPTGQHNIITDSLYLAVTVARPFSDQEMNDAEEILLTQLAYDYLMRITNTLRTDQRDSLTRHLTAGADAQPFHAPKLNNSIGWTIEFVRKGVLQE